MKISTRLFLEHGYDNTTVDQIVDHAELSQRTFFRYFPNKEAVMFRDFSRRERRLLDLLQEKKDKVSPFDRIRNALLGMAGDYADDRDTLLAEYKIVTQSKHLIALDVEQDLRLEKHVAATLREWKGKPFLTDREADIVAGAIFGSIRSAMGKWFEGGCAADLDEVKGECLKVVDCLQEGFPGRT